MVLIFINMFYYDFIYYINPIHLLLKTKNAILQ